jgi:hypothetical protein
MQAYQERVIEERNDLVEKVNKLTEFLDNSEAVSTLLPGEEGRLKTQLAVMQAYVEVLDSRIEFFQ